MTPKRNLSNIVKHSATPPANSRKKVNLTAVLDQSLDSRKNDKVAAFPKVKEIVVTTCNNGEVKHLAFKKPHETLNPRRKWSMEDAFYQMMKETRK